MDRYALENVYPEHGPNVNFTNPSGSTNPLDWNIENPTKGFCYRANSKNYPFDCDQDCQSKCATNTNDTIKIKMNMIQILIFLSVLLTTIKVGV